ncbi:hypothetical protein CSAL01_04044 [Colletotrichum salicis]|uniref:F-box domain-containing protein n=1 Tax=Colletotrichum salicis TaxID=1209931 RepID=A0A135V8I7_9PEZI|nr:hypothetical protein CSAL01_04044 [Colletotrichum salicis]
MAVLDELPPEIIRMVCAFLHPPDVPLNTVVADTGHLREEVLHGGWKDVFSLSPTCRKYHKIIGHSAYHTISVPQIGIRPLLSLLRLIIKKPAIDAAVKRLNLEMSYQYRLKEDEDEVEDELTAFTILEGWMIGTDVGAAFNFNRPPIPGITSLAKRSISDDFTTGGVPLVELLPSIQRLSLIGTWPFCFDITPAGLPENCLRNLTDVTANGFIKPRDVADFVERFSKQLSAFRYIYKDKWSNQVAHEYEPAWPSNIVNALLPHHACSLRTLCFDYTDYLRACMWRYRLGRRRITLPSLAGLCALENLWMEPFPEDIDLGGAQPKHGRWPLEADASAMMLKKLLPRSMKWIYFAGGFKHDVKPLVWFATNAGSLPSLSQIDLTDKAMVDKLGGLFTEEGVNLTHQYRLHCASWDVK